VTTGRSTLLDRLAAEPALATKRRRTAPPLAGLEAALEALSAPALIVSRLGQIAYANREAKNLAVAERGRFTSAD